MIEKLGGLHPYPIGLATLHGLVEYHAGENFRHVTINAPPETDDLVALGRYQDKVSAFSRRPNTVEVFIEAFSRALAAFFSHAPPGYLVSDEVAAAIAEGAYPGAFMTTIGDAIENPGEAIQTLMFELFGQDVIESGILSELRKQLDRNFEEAKGSKPADRTEGARELASIYLKDTLFEHLFELPVPYALPESARTRTQWILGEPGSGKTTFISAMLLNDLQRVVQGQASVFVMDSQNELVPEIARLAIFGPGGPLHGKLIYLEPDPEYPLALNIFDMHPERMAHLSAKDRMMLERGAVWMVEFFLSSLLKAESSSHQDTFLRYVIPALMAIPDATIFTFKELLEPATSKNGIPPGIAKYGHHFAKLRPDVQQWLSQRLHSTEIAVTRNAIRSRLDGFTADPFFHDMFVHPRNRLDMFDELQRGKVILVNTVRGVLKGGTEPFGRYFIARLLQAMEERQLVRKDARLPVYAYIDEASDYISEEENIEELIDKGRKQKVCLIFANQRLSQIKSLTVRDALARAAIQCRGEPVSEGAPTWTVSIDRRAPMQISVAPVSFSDMPPMDDRHYAAMMNQMRERYYKPRDPVALPAPSDETVDPKRRKRLPKRDEDGDTDDPTAWR
jgi:hypothetical protein